MEGDTTSQDFARLEGGSTLVIQRWMPGPVDRLWRYLTESEFRAKWLASGDMRLAPGASLELVWRNDGLSDPSDHRPEEFPQVQRMDSEVIAVEPMRRLTIAWGAGEVTFALEPKGDRVLLTLTHSGLDDPAGRSMIAAGWHMHLDILKAGISGDKAGSFWSGWVALRDTYADRFRSATA